MKTKTIRNVLLAAFLVGSLGLAAQADVTAYVVHGIDGDDFGLDPDLPVDVFVSGLGCALPGFAFGDRVGPLNVAAGDYDISIFLTDGTEPCGGTEVIDLDSGGNDVLQKIRKIHMRVGARLTQDPAIDRVLEDLIRVRNDVVI